MRALRAFILITTFATHSLGHATPSFCNAVLGGTDPATTLLLKDDDADFMRLSSTKMAPGSLDRLAVALAKHGYYGPLPKNSAGLVVEIFDVSTQKSVDVVTPTITVRLGARFFRDGQSFKIRVDLPFANVEPVDAVALAVTDILNHAELLRRPAVLTREMNLLRAQLSILNANDFKPLIDQDYIAGALTALGEAPDLIPFLGSTSGFLGARFKAYFRARQMLVHAWLKTDVAERRRLATATWHRHYPTRHLDEDLLDLATRGPRLLGRPFYFTVDRRQFEATALWFETLLNHQSGPPIFLNVRRPEELTPAQAASFDRPLSLRRYAGAVGIDPGAEWLARLSPQTAASSGVDLSPSSDNPADPTRTSGVDPAPIATGIPDVGGSDIGIPSGVDDNDIGGAGPGL